MGGQLRGRRSRAPAPARSTSSVRARECRGAGPGAAKHDRSWRDAWVVRVTDDVDERIAGHAGTRYISPPQPRACALALVALLIGPRDGDRGEHWTVATAGGRQVVDLDPTD